MTVDEDLSDIQHVRKRPGMYIGSTGFFGTIHYLVDATNLILQHTPSVVEICVNQTGFAISSDVALPVHTTESGELYPFETFRRDGNAAVSHGPVLTALSEFLTYSERSDNGNIQYAYRNGSRSETDLAKWPTEYQSHLRFAPDPAIFDNIALSNYNFHSYLRRLSYLNPSTRFTFNDNGTKHVFHSENGLVDMFVGFSAPYQLVHEPICLSGTEGNFAFEFVFALHSWKNDVCCAFVNKGRAVEGGTHQKGLDLAIEQLRTKTFTTSNGVIGLLSIQYPDVQWEGCIKAKIGSSELKSLVFNSIVDATDAWISDHPVVLDQIKNVQTFQFPDAWFR